MSQGYFDSKQQNRDIIAFMKQNPHVGLTVVECERNGMGSELRKRISELHLNDKYVFDWVWEPNSKNKGRHKRYFLVACPDRSPVGDVEACAMNRLEVAA